MKLKNFEFKKSDVLPILIASIGLIWQIHSISKVYFQYTTQVDIAIEVPFKISMPALTICVELGDASSSKENRKDSELAFIPINEIADIASPQVEIACTVPAPLVKENASNNLLCEDLAPPKFTIQYIHRQQISRCITYFGRSFNETPYEVITSDAKDFYQITVKQVKNSTVYFFVHDPVELLHMSEADTISFNVLRLQEMVLATSKIRTNFLPPPYRTNCRDYNKFKYGRWGCVFQCRIEQLQKKCSVWPKNVPALPSCKLPFRMPQDNCSTFIDEHLCYKKMCHQRPCWGEWYTTTTIFTRERVDQESKSVFFIRRPMGVEFTYNYNPKLAEIEYVCYVASCFGIWFGISCVDCLRLVINSYKFEEKKFYAKVEGLNIKKNDYGIHRGNNNWRSKLGKYRMGEIGMGLKTSRKMIF